jgi:hypothetical protein
MTDEFNEALKVTDAASISPDGPASAAARAAETIRSASRRVNDAIETGRQPDMPLDILVKFVREAPLHSLAIAFLLGVTIARRR